MPSRLVVSCSVHERQQELFGEKKKKENDET